MSSRPAPQAPTQTQTVVQSSDPWAGQQPYLRDLFSRAQTYVQQPAGGFFPGQMVAGPGADTTRSFDYARSLATTTLPAASDVALQSAMFNMGAGRDVGTNPYLQSAIQAAQRPVIEAFSSPTGPMSAIRSHFTAGNTAGSGTREGVAQGIALRGLGQQLTDMSAGITWQAYQQAQDNAIRSLALMPQTMQASSFPVELLSQAGAQQDAYRQALIDAEMQKWFYEQQEPVNKLLTYQNLISGNFGGTSTGSTTTTGSLAPQPRTNPWMSALGGAAAGTAIKPGVGTALGALIGFLGGR